MQREELRNVRVATENPEATIVQEIKQSSNQLTAPANSNAAKQNLEGSVNGTSDSIALPPVPARKRGKCMTRRKGQNPGVRIKKRTNGEKVYYFQYRLIYRDGKKESA
jgi:hypothetical protein